MLFRSFVYGYPNDRSFDLHLNFWKYIKIIDQKNFVLKKYTNFFIDEKIEIIKLKKFDKTYDGFPCACKFLRYPMCSLTLAFRHMQDYPPGGSSFSPHKPHRSLFERLTALISPEPENRTELLEILHDAHERNLIDADALSMIEGVFQVSDLCARDIMIPRSQMDVVDIARPIEEWIPMVLSTAHSRFPAVEGDRDKVVGILLAKDLLRYYAQEEIGRAHV